MLCLIQHWTLMFVYYVSHRGVKGGHCGKCSYCFVMSDFAF